MAQRLIHSRLTRWGLASRLAFLTAIAVPVSWNSLRGVDVSAWQSLAAHFQPSAPIETQVLRATATSTLTLGAKTLGDKTLGGKTLGDKTLGDKTIEVDRSDLHETFVPSPNQPPVFTRGFGTR